VFDAVGDPLVVVGPDGEIRAANAAAHRFFGLTRGSTLSTVLGRMPIDAGAFAGCVERHESARGIAVPDRNGRPTGIRVDVDPVCGPEGEPLSVLHIHAPADALARELWTNDVVATVAHELRNPLCAMRHALGILDSEAPGPLLPDQRRFIEALDRSVRRLARMADGYLDLTHAQTGVVSLTCSAQDVRACVRAMIDDFVVLYPRAAGRIACNDGHAVPAWVDRDRMEQVMVNLLANALRFSTGDGAIQVTVAGAGREALADDLRLLPWEYLGEPRFARIDVEDHGLGMSPETLAHVFDPAHASGDGAGAHLGLHITRSIVEAHDGTLSVESRLGEGTVCSVLVPADARTAAILARLRAAAAARERLTAARRPVSVLVLGKHGEEDWRDILRGWTVRPEINPVRTDVPVDATVWTLGGGIAVAVVPGARAADVARVVGPRVGRSDDGAWVMRGHVLGWHRTSDGLAFTTEFNRAHARMRSALSTPDCETEDAGRWDDTWLTTGVHVRGTTSHKE